MHPRTDYRFSEGLAAVKINGLYGYVDTSGSVVIQPQFGAAFAFSGGLARVELPNNGKTGFIDKQGATVIPAQFAGGSDFSEGLAAVQFGSFDMAFIDVTGKVVTPHVAEAWGFSSGLAPVAIWTPPQRPQYGFIDKTGNFAIPAHFDSITVNQGPAFSEGFAIVGVGQTRTKYGYVDTAGNMAIPPQFDAAGPFHDGLAAVFTGLKHGFIDKSGSWVIPPQFDIAFNFSEGLARVTLGARPSDFGFIDKAGKAAIPPPAGLFVIDEFFEGRARVQRGDGPQSTCGYLDITGALAIPIQFDFCGRFSEGFSLVSKNGKDGAIDRNGQVVIPLQYGG